METVLVVDDARAVRDYCKSQLEQEGYRVLTASNGVEALESLLEYPVDLVVLDLHMRPISGAETARRIRGAHPAVAIVFHTTCAASELSSYRSLADACVRKDADLSELKRNVADQLFTRDVQRMLLH